MKVLLDECLPIDFRHHFPGHEVHTVEWAGFKGRKNGHLLHEAEAAGYQVFLTVDQGIPYQPNFEQRTISILVIRSRTNQMKTSSLWLKATHLTLGRIRPGDVAFVS